MMYHGKQIQKTTVHNWAYNGKGVFNERHVHTVSWPCAKPWTNLKLQVFHILKEDDALCEAVIPLWDLLKAVVADANQKVQEKVTELREKNREAREKGMYVYMYVCMYVCVLFIFMWFVFCDMMII